MHIGGMMGTWMTANVFRRIIPRQILMVEASKKGEPVNQDWGKNAKNRSTHNTYLTLPVIFVMLSNHFPNTYGHDLNWLILLLITAGGAAIREYFVVRLMDPKRSLIFAAVGIALITGVIVTSSLPQSTPTAVITHEAHIVLESPAPVVETKDELTPTDRVSSKAYPVKGFVSFEGTPPVGKKLTLPSGCSNPGTGDVFSNEVIVKNGRLQNVLISLKADSYPKVNDQDVVPSQEVILDQKNCMYHPRVAAARVGQKVTFVNSDAIFHNVRSITSVNEKFNMAMPKKNQRFTKVFTRPELFLQAKCSVHPWMGAYVAIFDHPYYAVTNERGEYSLPQLPVGSYTLEAWHETLGTQTLSFVIHDDGVKEQNFTFKGQP